MAISDLTTARSNLEALLASESENPKPSYTVKGRSVDWTTWAKTIQERIDMLSKTINARSPYIVTTRQSL